MPIVISNATLTDMPADWWPSHPGSIMMYNRVNYDYAALYSAQPNVRTCVDFIARNVAQLGIHVFRKDADGNKIRLNDHPLVSVLNKPLPAEYKVTRYRMIESLMADYGIYLNAFMLKIKIEGAPLGLLRLPPQYITVHGGLVPTQYEFNFGGERKLYDPDTVVHIGGYNPNSSTSGLSPLETLRRILAEEQAAGDYREHFWQNSARISGVIERPIAAPKWSETARTRFKAEFEALHAGPENSAKTAILEEGMTWKSVSFTPEQSEYMEGRKLTREECARAYHIPPPLVGILDNATYSNIQEQHKMLYTDVIGPYLSMLEQDFQSQLLPEVEDAEGVFMEFNIAEKLQGDFETQSKSLQSAIGRPWMTANEGRTIMNLPKLDDPGADQLVTPLNVLMGTQASPNDSDSSDDVDYNGEKNFKYKKQDEIVISGTDPIMFEAHRLRWTELYINHYQRQERTVLSALPGALDSLYSEGVWWDSERWNRELQEDLIKMNLFSANAWASRITNMVGVEFSLDLLVPWITKHSEVQAQNVNEYTYNTLSEAIKAEDPMFSVKNVFLTAVGVWALSQAITSLTSISNFGAIEGAKAGKLKSKTWVTNSNKPRHDHLKMDGETVGIRELFSNGMKWPGDPAGGAENNSNCLCTVKFNR